MSADKFAPLMEAVARKLLGKVNKLKSSKTELRFGTNGSLSVDLSKGTWFDHEAGKGGGVLALIRRQKGLANGAAVAWMRDELRIQIDEKPAPNWQGKSRRRVVAAYPYVDERGELLFEVCRLDPKDFRQRRPDGNGAGPGAWAASAAFSTACPS
jgi:hypothetical protein